MNFLKYIALFLLVIILASCQQRNISLESPNGRIRFEFNLNQVPSYNISFMSRDLIRDSYLRLFFKDGGEFKNLKVGKPAFRSGTEKYDLVVGKAGKVEEPFREVIIPLRDQGSPSRALNLVVRAFNDGLAFRYEFQETGNRTTLQLADEQTFFHVQGDPKVLTMFLPDYKSSHEALYSSLLVSEIPEDTLMDLPVLLEFPDSVYMGITEAALADYAGMYMLKHEGVLKSSFAPHPADSSVKVLADLPHRSPWRVFMISDRVGALIESNIITNLNEPLKLQDVSWIEPCKTTWPWWNGNVISDPDVKGGNNFETNKYFIDFCARNGIETHSIVEFGGHEWYVNDGGGFQPGPNVDVTRPVPELDMMKVSDYAREKGVGIRVWVHFGALYPRLDDALAKFEKWGIAGMMVDFMDRDDQQMVNMQNEILRKAADHKIHVQFHGAYKPTGLHRTYPNEFTREGTLNYEVNKWGKITPDHDINIPFTRMLAGSTDYHLGGFRAVPESEFETKYDEPVVIGTRAHMLAMYVVLENYLGMLSDFPSAYEGQAGFEFLKNVPTVWDETKVIDARVGEYIAIGRKKNDDWFIGVITNSKSRSFKISFSFLDEGNYEGVIYQDAGDSDENPNSLDRKTVIVNRNDVYELKLAHGGGAAMHLRREQAKH